MSGVNVQIDPELAKNYGNNIVSSADEYGSQIKQIYEIVDDLKQTWSGQAASRFTDNIESFRADFESLQKYLSQVGDLLIDISNDYIKLENEL